MTDSDEPLVGSWTQSAPRRLIGQVILVLATLGAAAGFGLLFVVQTFEALAVLVGFTNVALLTYLSLSSSAPTTVTLAGPMLTVRCGRDTDTFDLSGPVRRIGTYGFPNRPNWRLMLETIDGKVIELGPTQVDPETITAALKRYRPPTIPQQRTGSEPVAEPRLPQA